MESSSNNNNTQALTNISNSNTPAIDNMNNPSSILSTQSNNNNNNNANQNTCSSLSSSNNNDLISYFNNSQNNIYENNLTTNYPYNNRLSSSSFYNSPGLSSSSYSPYNTYGSNYMYNQQIGQNYSNNPMLNKNQNPQAPSTNFRNDFWGTLQGFNCILNILYAGSGMINYGKIFLKMSFKVIKYICGKSLHFLFKITGVNYLMKTFFHTDANSFAQDFINVNSTLSSLWNDTNLPNATNRTLIGRIIFALRVCSILGTVLFLFLRKRAINSPTPYGVGQLEPPLVNGQIIQSQNFAEEQLSNKYVLDEIVEEKVEADKEEEEEASAEATNNTKLSDTITNITNEEALAKNEEKENNGAIHDTNNNQLQQDGPIIDLNNNHQQQKAHETQIHEEKPNLINSSITEIPPKILVNDSEKEIKPIEKCSSIIDPIPEQSKENTLLPNLISLGSELEIPKNPEAIAITDNMKNAIRSEDFWKSNDINKPVDESSNNLLKEVKDINKVPEFQAPSMLQTLGLTKNSSSSGGSKPWLKKTKTSAA